MATVYIRTDKIVQKLKEAEEKRMPLYVHSHLGMGKTLAVEQYFKGRSALWLTGASGQLNQMPDVDKIRQEVIVADDISWITDTDSRIYIRTLLGQKRHIVVLIGRCNMPEWILREYLSGQLLTADAADLCMTAKHVRLMAQEMNVPLSPPDKELRPTAREAIESAVAENIAKECGGVGLVVKCTLMEMGDTGTFNRGVYEKACLFGCKYVDETFTGRWIPQVQELLLSLADFETFDQGLAVAVSGLSNVPALLDYIGQIGDFLKRDQNGQYRIIWMMRIFLKWKQDICYTAQKKQIIRERAAVYYQSRDHIADALEQYRKVGQFEKIEALLTEQARKNPAARTTLLLKPYYEMLPQEKSEASPILMTAMSMMESIELHPVESENWYQRIKAYEKREDLTDEELQQTKRCLAYLDIGLPHRGTAGLTKAMERFLTSTEGRTQRVLAFPVTGNQPGIMNGGKDLSEWSNQEKEVDQTLRRVFDQLLGSFGKGMADILLGEIAFEKMQVDGYTIISRIQTGLNKAQRDGRIEICFAGIGVLIRLHLSHGQTDLALALLNDFEERAHAEKAENLYPAIRAFRARIALKKGDMKFVHNWMEEAPNEDKNFSVLDRFSYMVKLRCYIALEQYEAAWRLSLRLDEYFRIYHRTSMWIENTTLRAIIAWRTQNEEWKTLFDAAFEKAQSYHFISVMAQEGSALEPLLRARKPEKKSPFYTSLCMWTRRMSVNYPYYLGRIFTLEEPLTQTEQQILQLHAEGFSTKQICESCHISLNTLKFHNSNLYRKLDVKSRQQAVSAARQLKLVE